MLVQNALKGTMTQELRTKADPFEQEIERGILASSPWTILQPRKSN